MISFLKRHALLIAVMFLAVAIRLPAVSYGLPYHLLADEETSVYGALKMIDLRTVLPVLHRDDFDTLLYYPPGLAYIYVIFFLPAILIKYLSSGLSLDHLKAVLTIDPSIFWYIARSLGIVFGLANIWLVYRIGKHIFKKDSLAVLGAFLFSTSFLTVTMDPTAHHWTAGIFFCLLSSYVLLRTLHPDFNGNRNHRLALAGLILGIAFGTSYLVVYVPPLIIMIAYCRFKNPPVESMEKRLVYKNVLWNILYFVVPFTALAIFFIVIHPGAFLYQAGHGGEYAYAMQSIAGFIVYYVRAIWNYELPLLLISFTGLIVLFRRKRETFYLILTCTFVMGVVMYIFMYNNPRYLLPLIPILALMSTYAYAELSPYFLRTLRKKIFIYTGALILALYFVAVYGKYEILLSRGDTRLMARDWIERTLPKGSTIITDTDRLRLSGTPGSIRAQAKVDDSSLRAADRILLQNSHYATYPFNVYPIFFLTGEKRKDIIAAALFRKDPHTYLVIDSWILDRSHLDPLISKSTLIKSFWSNVTRHDWHDLFIGGEKTNSRLHLLLLLYSVDYLGPDIAIYKL